MNGRRIGLLLALLLVLAACEGRTSEPMPTRIPSVDALATSTVLTENAPPPGFRETVSFARVDTNLSNLPNWRAEVQLSFDGVFSGTPRPARASMNATLWYNRLDVSRRVLIGAEGVLFGTEADEPLVQEGVRLGEDTFLVQDYVCAAVNEERGALLADLGAGDFIGGVSSATPAGQRAVINGETVYRYTFSEDALNLPGFRFGEASRIVSMSSELWIAPEHNAVIRFWITMTVENTVITLLANDPESAPPVTGDVILRYDLYDIGVNPNITQPYGC